MPNNTTTKTRSSRRISTRNIKPITQQNTDDTATSPSNIGSVPAKPRRSRSKTNKKNSQNSLSSRSSSRGKRRPDKKTPLFLASIFNQKSLTFISAASCIVSILLIFATISELLPFFVDVRLNDDFTGNHNTTNVMGTIGHKISSTLIHIFGWCALLILLMVAIESRYLIYRNTHSSIGEHTKSKLAAKSCLVLSVSTVMAIIFGRSAGGEIGSLTAGALVYYFNNWGSVLLSTASLLISAHFAFEPYVNNNTKIGYTAKLTDTLIKLLSSILSAFSRCVAFILRHITDLARYLVSTTLDTLTYFLRSFLNQILQLIIVMLKVLLKIVLKQPYQVLQYMFRLFSARNKEPAINSNTSTIIRLTAEQEIATNKTQITVNKTIRDPKISNHKAKDNSELQVKSLRDAQSKILSNSTSSIGKRFKLPPLDLLDVNDKSSLLKQDEAELLQNSRFLEKALADFKIGGSIIEVQPGPVITLYQFEPAPGIKVQRIISLADDLALALKVASVRVYAPVPGKGTVGIEVPNAQRETVRLRDVLGSSEYVQSNANLILALGKDTFGDPFVADLAKMPHLLIAGATGTGKSVCINSLLLSLLFRNTPQDLRLILIDPKMLELSVYENIPHLKSPVITNPKRARGILWWAVEEMERRYSLMKDLGVRNLASYNRAVSQGNRSTRLTAEDHSEDDDSYDDVEDMYLDGDAPSSKTIAKTIKAGKLTTIPRIVIVVDEMADLMLTVGKEIEELLTRLAQKARASGIHLILATQRPSVNVITGLIKANFPTRISFQVASRIDSRTVLDSSGSERLLGMGDMLYMSPGIGKLKRMHSAYVSDSEVQNVTDFLIAQGPPDYDEEIEAIIDKFEESEKSSSNASLGSSANEEYDPFYDQAVQLVLEKGIASASMVQRAFRIGYNRAARIIETMEKEGLVGPADGAKPRQIIGGSL